MGTTTLSSGLSLGASTTLSGGALTATATATVNTAGATASHSRISGKYYFEVTFNALTSIGTGAGIRVNGSTYPGVAGTAVLAAEVFKSGSILVNGSTLTGLGSTVSSSTAGVALDLDNKLIWFRKASGNWNGNALADPATGVGGYDISAFTPAAGVYPCCTLGATGDAATFNFAGSFVAAAPSGFGLWPDAIETVVNIDLGSEATGQFSGGSSGTVILPGTDDVDRVVIVTTHSDGTPGAQANVSSVSGGGLTWALHKRFAYTGNGHDTVEIWWVHAPAKLGSTTITVTMAAGIDDASLGVFAVGNANTTGPFDIDASIPGTNTSASGVASVTGISTASTKGLLIGVWSNDNGPTAGGLPSAGNGYAPLYTRVNNGGTNWSLQLVEALAYKTARSSVTVDTQGSRTKWGMIATAIPALNPTASLVAAQTVPAFTQALTGKVTGKLVQSKAIPDFGQALTGVHTPAHGVISTLIPAFPQALRMGSTVKGSLSQTINPFGVSLRMINGAIVSNVRTRPGTMRAEARPRRVK